MDNIAGIIIALATLVSAFGGLVVAWRAGNKVAVIEQKVEASTAVSMENAAKLETVAAEVVAVKAIAVDTKVVADKTHNEVNSKMALLLKTTGEAEKAKGVIEGAGQKGTAP